MYFYYQLFKELVTYPYTEMQERKESVLDVFSRERYGTGDDYDRKEEIARKSAEKYKIFPLSHLASIC
jgi:hypothetical protein